jgi:hypothetical protein
MLNNNTYSSLSLLIPFILFNIFAIEQEKTIIEKPALSCLKTTALNKDAIHINASYKQKPQSKKINCGILLTKLPSQLDLSVPFKSLYQSPKELNTKHYSLFHLTNPEAFLCSGGFAQYIKEGIEEKDFTDTRRWKDINISFKKKDDVKNMYTLIMTTVHSMFVNSFAVADTANKERIEMRVPTLMFDYYLDALKGSLYYDLLVLFYFDAFIANANYFIQKRTNFNIIFASGDPQQLMEQAFQKYLRTSDADNKLKQHFPFEKNYFNYFRDIEDSELYYTLFIMPTGEQLQCANWLSTLCYPKVQTVESNIIINNFAETLLHNEKFTEAATSLKNENSLSELLELPSESKLEDFDTTKYNPDYWFPYTELKKTRPKEAPYITNKYMPVESKLTNLDNTNLTCSISFEDCLSCSLVIPIQETSKETSSREYDERSRFQQKETENTTPYTMNIFLDPKILKEHYNAMLKNIRETLGQAYSQKTLIIDIDNFVENFNQLSNENKQQIKKTKEVQEMQEILVGKKNNIFDANVITETLLNWIIDEKIENIKILINEHDYENCLYELEEQTKNRYIENNENLKKEYQPYIIHNYQDETVNKENCIKISITNKNDRQTRDLMTFFTKLQEKVKILDLATFAVRAEKFFASKENAYTSKNTNEIVVIQDQNNNEQNLQEASNKFLNHMLEIINRIYLVTEQGGAIRHPYSIPIATEDAEDIKTQMQILQRAFDKREFWTAFSPESIIGKNLFKPKNYITSTEVRKAPETSKTNKFQFQFESDNKTIDIYHFKKETNPENTIKVYSLNKPNKIESPLTKNLEKQITIIEIPPLDTQKKDMEKFTDNIVMGMLFAINKLMPLKKTNFDFYLPYILFNRKDDYIKLNHALTESFLRLTSTYHENFPKIDYRITININDNENSMHPRLHDYESYIKNNNTQFNYNLHFESRIESENIMKYINTKSNNDEYDYFNYSEECKTNHHSKETIFMIEQTEKNNIFTNSTEDHKRQVSLNTERNKFDKEEEKEEKEEEAISKERFIIKTIAPEFEIEAFHKNLIDKEAFTWFTECYNRTTNGFFGEKIKDNPKQDAIFKKIQNIMTKGEDLETFKKLMNNIMLVHPAGYSDASITEFNRARTPVNISGKITKRNKNFDEIMWPENQHANYATDAGLGYGEPLPVQALTILSPWWQWDPKTKTLNDTGKEFATFFTHAIDFSNEKSQDYQNYGDNTKDESKEKTLVEKITKIMETIIITALKETAEKTDKKICHLRVSKMGLGAFATCYKDKEKLVNFYMEALANAMKKYNGKNGITIYVSLYNFINEQMETEVQVGGCYKKAFEEHLADNTYVHLHEKNTNNVLPSLFNQTLIHPSLQTKDTFLEILVNPGDARSFFFNAGYSDNSFEKFFLGFSNNDFLGFAAAANFMLSSLCNTEQTVIQYYDPIKEEEKLAADKLEEKELAKEIAKAKRERGKNSQRLASLIVGMIVSYLARTFIEQQVKDINASNIISDILRSLAHVSIPLALYGGAVGLQKIYYNKIK